MFNQIFKKSGFNMFKNMLSYIWWCIMNSMVKYLVLVMSVVVLGVSLGSVAFTLFPPESSDGVINQDVNVKEDVNRVDNSDLLIEESDWI